MKKALLTILLMVVALSLPLAARLPNYSASLGNLVQLNKISENLGQISVPPSGTTTIEG